MQYISKQVKGLFTDRYMYAKRLRVDIYTNRRRDCMQIEICLQPDEETVCRQERIVPGLCNFILCRCISLCLLYFVFVSIQSTMRRAGANSTDVDVWTKSAETIMKPDILTLR